MKTVLLIIVCVALSVGIALIAEKQLHQQYASGATTPAPVTKESVYDRVERTGTIRCGYISWPPFLIKDANTGKVSGIFVDYLEALAKNLHLKIDWAMENGWGDFVEALNTDKIDAFCAGAWPNSERAVHADFIRPISYQAFSAFVRAGDARFDNNIARANSADVTAAEVDGSTNALVSNTDFPLSKKDQMPQTTEVANTFMEVETGKADITFMAIYPGAEFMANNPGKIQQVKLVHPLRAFGNVILIKPDQYRFKAMLDSATEELINSGQIESFIAKGEKYPGSIYRVADPYKLPQPQTGTGAP